MRRSFLLVAAVIALGAVPIARPSTSFTTCGTVSGGGAVWTVTAANVSCRVAKPLVKTLAAKPHPGLATRLGTHSGLTCIEYARKATREIACTSRDGTKTVYGTTPPHK